MAEYQNKDIANDSIDLKRENSIEQISRKGSALKHAFINKNRDSALSSKIDEESVNFNRKSSSKLGHGAESGRQLLSNRQGTATKSRP